MLNKQTLVAQAKQYFDNLFLNEKRASVLYKEMFDDVLMLYEKFQTFSSGGVFRLCPGASIHDTMGDTIEVIHRIGALLHSSGPHQEKLLDARFILSKGKESMGKFIKHYNDGSWTTLSRSDILQLRNLLKKNEWVLKQKEVNLNKLRKDWDEADIIKNIEDCITQKGLIQAGQSIH